MARTPPLRPIREIGTVTPQGSVVISPRFMRWLEEQQQTLTVIEDGDVISSTAAIGTRYAASGAQAAVGTAYPSETTDRASTAYATDSSDQTATTYAAETSDPAGTTYT